MPLRLLNGTKSLCPGRGFAIEYRRNENRLALQVEGLVGQKPEFHVAPWEGIVLGKWVGGGPDMQGPGRKFVPMVFHDRRRALEQIDYEHREANIDAYDYRVVDISDKCFVREKEGRLRIVPRFSRKELR